MGRTAHPTHAVAAAGTASQRRDRGPSLAAADQLTVGGGVMIQQAYITAWRAVAPWPDDAQIDA